MRAVSTPVEEVEAHRLPDSEHEGPGDWTEITLRHEDGESAEPRRSRRSLRRPRRSLRRRRPSAAASASA